MARPELRGGVRPPGALRAERARGREAGARLAALPGAVPGHAGHPASDSHRRLSRAVGLRARLGAPLRGPSHLRNRAPQRHPGLRPGVAGREGCGSAAGDVRGRGWRGTRRRAAECPGVGARTGRRDTRRRGRHNSGRRAPDPVHRLASLRGVSHGREPAGTQGRPAHRGGGRPRGPEQYGLLRHGGDIRARQGRGDGDGDAERAGQGSWFAAPHRRRGHSTPERARPHGQAARRHRYRHRGGHSRHHPSRRRGDAALRQSSTS